jgi:hypothetical protein
MLYYVLHSDFNVTLSEAKGLTSYDRFFATLRTTFWAKPALAGESSSNTLLDYRKTPSRWVCPSGIAASAPRHFPDTQRPPAFPTLHSSPICYFPSTLHAAFIPVGVTQLNTISQAEDHRVPVQNYSQLRKSYPH